MFEVSLNHVMSAISRTTVGQTHTHTTRTRIHLQVSANMHVWEAAAHNESGRRRVADTAGLATLTCRNEHHPLTSNTQLTLTWNPARRTT